MSNKLWSIGDMAAVSVPDTLSALTPYLPAGAKRNAHEAIGRWFGAVLFAELVPTVPTTLARPTSILHQFG